LERATARAAMCRPSAGGDADRVATSTVAQEVRMLAHPTTRRTALAVAGGCLAALSVAAPAPAAADTGCAAATPSALAGYFDATIPGRLGPDSVPGVVVSVVAGDTTAFARGYGLADVERKVPFDADRTLVRIGSVTKLFTWTAVLQQVEAGRLDLDADVNRYLSGWQIPATYTEPVTLRTLMNHTAGFEERIIGTAARTAADVPPLERFLAANLPARIRPPGEVSAYSNYGAALAGHIVARVSGEPYDVYIGRHLLDPLGMSRSTATEPVPAGLAADLAASYDSETSPARRIPFMYDVMTPDGSISATAADLARFMRAHLSGGGGLLQPATVARMHQRTFAADGRLNGYAHGFMDRTINGRRVLMHDGAWEGFLSALVLVPECDLGLFLSTNATGGISAVGDVVGAFVDRFAPAPEASVAAVPATGRAGVTAGSPLAGFYHPARHNESTVEKLVSLLGPARLTVAADGTVGFRGKRWTPVRDGLYRAADGSDRLVFLAGADGRRYVATDGATYQLMPAAQTPLVNLAVVLGFVVVALTALVVALVWLGRRLARRPVAVAPAWRVARGLGAGAAVLGLVFVVGLGAVLFGDTSEFLYGVPTSFRLLMVAPLVVLALAGASAVCTVAAWRGAGAGVAARAHQVVVLAGLGALTWFLVQWNLIGWQF
jgi:CubicO group peptidase (beta-lactamase class C family)